MRMRFERLMENWTDSIELMEFMSKFKLTTTLARELSVYDACEGESTIINLVYFNNGDEMRLGVNGAVDCRRISNSA